MSARKNYVDCLKAIAIIGVIVDHVATEYIKPELNVGTLFQYVILYGLTRFCVGIFFMMTGVLLLNKDKELTIKSTLRRIVNIIIAAFLYGLLYKLVRAGVGIFKIGAWPFIKEYIFDFITGNMEFHFWYIYALIGIYLMLPIIKIFTDHAEKNHLQYFLIIWIITNALYIFSADNHLMFISNIFNSYHFVGVYVGYLGFLILGVYIDRYDIKFSVIYFELIIGLLLIVGASVLTTYDLKRFGQVRVEYLALCAAPAVVLALGLCRLLKEKTSLEVQGISKMYTWLGKNTLSIYFVHMIFIIVMIQYDKFVISINPIIDTILYSVIVMGLSVLYTLVIKKIPVVRKYL